MKGRHVEKLSHNFLISRASPHMRSAVPFSSCCGCSSTFVDPCYSSKCVEFMSSCLFAADFFQVLGLPFTALHQRLPQLPYSLRMFAPLITQISSIILSNKFRTYSPIFPRLPERNLREQARSQHNMGVSTLILLPLCYRLDQEKWRNIPGTPGNRNTQYGSFLS